MGPPVDIRTLRYIDADKYQNKILLGNWFENRCKYTTEPHNFHTTYTDHYKGQYGPPVDPSFVWNQKFQGEGLNARLMFDHTGEKYVNNFSTVTDLAYNHYTKCLKGPFIRKFRGKFSEWVPDQDYARNYKNITKWGLLDAYHRKWEDEKAIDTTAISVYKQDYIPLDVKAETRRATPLSNSSKYDSVNNEVYFWRLRGKQLLRLSPHKVKILCYDHDRPSPIC